MVAPLLLAGGGALAYIVYRKHQDPTWDPLAFLRDGGSGINATNSGGFGNSNFTIPGTALRSPGGAPSTGSGITGTSQLGVQPITLHPITSPSISGPAIWRPAVVFPEVSNAGENSAQRGTVRDDNTWGGFAQSLGIAASVVNPGAWAGISAFGSMTGLTSNLSLAGIVSSISTPATSYGGITVDEEDSNDDLAQLSGPSEDDDAPAASPQIDVEVAALEAAGAGYEGGGDEGGGGWDGGGGGEG